MRVGSFNVMHGLSLTDGTVDPERFHAAIANLDADIVGLQEVDLDQPRSGGLDLAAAAAAALGAAPGDWMFVPTVHGTPGIGWRPADGHPRVGEPAYGIAVVSRLPVRRWRVIDLGRAPIRSPIAVPGGPNGRGRLIMLDDEPRIAIAAEVESDRGPVTIVNTHLSFVPGWNAVQLRRLVRRLAALPGPLILLGDLNLPGWLPTALTGWRRLATTPTYPAQAPRVQLDHVLSRDRGGEMGTVSGVRTCRATISDHLALLVDLTDPTG